MVAVFLADGFEDVEALSPIDYLRRGGADVVTVAITSSNPLDKRIVESSHNVSMFADVTADDFFNRLGSSLPDGIVFPGGLNGAKNLASSEKLSKLIKDCFAAGKIVSAICASPALVLSPTEVLKGKNWTCYPGMEKEVDPENVEDSEFASGVAFVTDGNLVTGAGPGKSEEFALELVRIFCGEENASQVKQGALCR